MLLGFSNFRFSLRVLRHAPIVPDFDQILPTCSVLLCVPAGYPRDGIHRLHSQAQWIIFRRGLRGLSGVGAQLSYAPQIGATLDRELGHAAHRGQLPAQRDKDWGRSPALWKIWKKIEQAYHPPINVSECYFALMGFCVVIE